MDRLQSLRVFVAVADAGSFAGGARALGISAPSATRGVAALEASLGARLFTRTTRQMRLSEPGRAYLEEVRDILAQLQAADEAASGTAARPVGTLRITCPQEFGRLHVAPLVADFLDAHAGIRAEVVMLDRVVNLIEEGFDVALRIGPLPPSDLTAVRLGEVRRVVCGAPGYLARHGTPAHPADLARHRLIVGGGDGNAAPWRVGPSGPRLTLSSVAACLDLAREGRGLTRALSYQVAADVAADRLRTVLTGHEPDPMPVHLVHAEGRRVATKLRAFIDFAAPRLRALPALRPAA
ncbi:LysR family transcriptional regulator [Paracoccus sp. ME4]|uniref:LysR family transcriptional regulator n=1 Tax=Paracoccus sp. ME4 TaxID=3138066 RepID=UPI00398B8C79